MWSYRPTLATVQLALAFGPSVSPPSPLLPSSRETGLRLPAGLAQISHEQQVSFGLSECAARHPFFSFSFVWALQGMMLGLLKQFCALRCGFITESHDAASSEQLVFCLAKRQLDLLQLLRFLFCCKR